MEMQLLECNGQTGTCSFVTAVTWVCIAKHTKNLGMLPEEEPLHLTLGLWNGWKSNTTIPGTSTSMPGTWAGVLESQQAKSLSRKCHCGSGFAQTGEMVTLHSRLLATGLTPFLWLLLSRWGFSSPLQPRNPPFRLDSYSHWRYVSKVEI